METEIKKMNLTENSLLVIYCFLFIQFSSVLWFLDLVCAGKITVMYGKTYAWLKTKYVQNILVDYWRRGEKKKVKKKAEGIYYSNIL